MAMYSASVLDSAKVDCFLADHAMTAPQKIIAYPKTDFLEFGSPAQSESE